jgi:hypothetical protein
MIHKESHDIRTLLLIATRQYTGTRNLMNEDDESDLRLGLQNEKMQQLSPRSFMRKHYEKSFYSNQELMNRLASNIDFRLWKLPSLRDLESKTDCESPSLV